MTQPSGPAVAFLSQQPLFLLHIGDDDGSPQTQLRPSLLRLSFQDVHSAGCLWQVNNFTGDGPRPLPSTRPLVSSGLAKGANPLKSCKIRAI